MADIAPGLEALTVGQEVWVDDINRRARPMIRARVIKLGRKLVTVDGSGLYGSEKVFRLDTGHTNNQYGHTWLLTDAMLAEREARETLKGRLKLLGVDDYNLVQWPSLHALTAVVSILEADRG